MTDRCVILKEPSVQTEQERYLLQLYCCISSKSECISSIAVTNGHSDPPARLAMPKLSTHLLWKGVYCKMNGMKLSDHEAQNIADEYCNLNGSTAASLAQRASAHTWIQTMSGLNQALANSRMQFVLVQRQGRDRKRLGMDLPHFYLHPNKWPPTLIAEE